MKKILIFRTDKLGDYVICSKILYSLKKRYGHLTVVCSNVNYKLISKQKFIDKIIIYHKKLSILKKIKIFLKLLFNYYYLIISWDGKKYSLLASLFLFSKYKVCLVYKKTKKIINFNFNLFRPSLLIAKIFFNKFLIFNSRNNLKKTEHLPTIYSQLVSEYINENNKDYYLEIDNKDDHYVKSYLDNNNIRDYIFIHFDEKWNDINLIEDDLFDSLILLSNKLKKKIIISSYNNNFKYFINLRYHFEKYMDKNIFFLEDLDINIFERFINYAILNITCHSGFLVQSTGFNKSNCVDILNENEKLWVSCWLPSNDKYKQTFKNNGDKRFSIKEIFNNIIRLYEKKI